MNKSLKISLLIMIAVVVGGVVVFGVDYLGQRFSSPEGPQEVILDKHACHFCGMHVGDIRFSAQIQTENETFFYDDAGCLIIDKHKITDPITAVYYHHYFEDRWIPENQVNFIKVAESPMGHGLGAIDKDDPDNGEERLSLKQAMLHVMSKGMRDPGTMNH